MEMLIGGTGDVQAADADVQEVADKVLTALLAADTSMFDPPPQHRILWLTDEVSK